MVPDIFRNMLILSVYEAKGLEFDDVILYNFFHLGDVSNAQWKLLNDIVFETVKRPKYKQDILDFDALDAENFEAFMRKVKD
jgi:ATP-dependent exoDNAse (exonuclease V) beta subunit